MSSNNKPVNYADILAARAEAYRPQVERLRQLAGINHIDDTEAQEDEA